MHSSERAPPYFLPNDILIDVMLGFPIFFIVRVSRPRVQRLFDLAVLGRCTAVMSERAVVGRGGAL